MKNKVTVFIMTLLVLITGCSNETEDVSEVANLEEISSIINEKMNTHVHIPTHDNLVISSTYIKTDSNTDEYTEVVVDYSTSLGTPVEPSDLEGYVVLEGMEFLFGPHEGDLVKYLHFEKGNTLEVNDSNITGVTSDGTEIEVHFSDSNKEETIDLEGKIVYYELLESSNVHSLSFEVENGTYSIGFDIGHFTREMAEDYTKEFILQIK